MNYLRSIVVALAFATLASVDGLASQSVDLGDKAMLQAGMQKHIDGRLVDGAYLHLDEDSGEVRELFPVAAHPMIMRMGKYFVLCSHFQDKGGKEVNVDFYMARRGNKFIVFKALVDDRKPLNRLINAGKVSRVN